MEAIMLNPDWILLNPDQIDNIAAIARSNAFLQTIFSVYNTEITESIVRLALKVIDMDIDMPEYIEAAVQKFLNQLTSESANALVELFMYSLYVIVPRSQKGQEEEQQITPNYLETIRAARKALEKFSAKNPPPMKSNKRKTSEVPESLFDKVKRKFIKKDVVVLPLEKLYVYKRFNSDPSVYQYEFKVFMRPVDVTHPTPVEIKDAMVFFDYEYINTKTGEISSLVVNVMPELIMCSTYHTTYAIGVTRRVNPAVAEISPALVGSEQVQGFIEHQAEETISSINIRRSYEAQNNIDNIEHSLKAYSKMIETYDRETGKNNDWDNMSKISPLAQFNPFINGLRKGYPLQSPPYPVKPGSTLVPIESPSPDPALSEHIDKQMRIIAGRFNLSMSWLQGNHSTGSMNSSSSSQMTESQLENKRSFTKRYSQIIEKHLKRLIEKLFDIEMFQIYEMVELFLIEKIGKDANRPDIVKIIQQTDLVVTLIGRSSPLLTADIVLTMFDKRIISREDRDSQILQMFNLPPNLLMDTAHIIEQIKEDIKIETVNAELTELKNNKAEDSEDKPKNPAKKPKKESE